MKRKVQLYIAGQQVDLGDDSWILYNWTREDMANPTAVVNSSSHQIQLPGTCRNNGVFGAAFRLDRRTLFGIRYDGTYFDPTRKTPFMLYDDDGTVLESGYCRLDEVNTHSRRHAYTVTLYGGLGSYFYALASKDDGTPRTLADLIWADMDGEDVTDFGIFPGPDTVQDAWAYLAGETPVMKSWWNCVNFGPAYNGIPSDFDASHAIMRGWELNTVPEGYGNLPSHINEGDPHVRPPAPETDYTYKAGLDCALISFTNPHTEWELGDLRWYLQRPVVSVKAFIAAVCDPRNNGGYTVTLDPTFFNDDNPAYASAWWTLAMIATEDRDNNQDCILNVLKASKTPMEYLVSYAKVYGLMFLWDSARHTVTIVTRATFYQQEWGGGSPTEGDETDYPTGYDTVNSTYRSLTTIENAYNSADHTDSRGRVELVRGAGATTDFYFTFDFSGIPRNAIIKTVSVATRTNMTSISSSAVASRGQNVCRGTTPVGENSTMNTTSTKRTLDSGEGWTRSNLDTLTVHVFAVRGTSSTSSANYINVYGVTVVVEYEIPADHTVLPVIDLSPRIDRGQQIRQDPVLADKRWYQLGDGGKGEFAENYAKDYGKGYGVQRIDTGYEFDAGTKILTDGIAFKDAAEVLESSLMFARISISGRAAHYYFLLPKWETVNYEMWAGDESKSFEMECQPEITEYFNPAYPYADRFPKVQLHGADNKAEDGADVLLYFGGMGAGSWYLTGDSPAMTDLAGGPCWDLTNSGTPLTAIPSFRRVCLSGRNIIESYEWGAPAVRPVPGISYPSGKPTAIYDRWWKRYLADRYAADTRVLTAMVDLRGLPVGQDLLRRFYWYDNALWTLNAIRNHSLTSHDLTECEFVKIQDKTAYTQGPGSELTQYLMITPDAAGFNLNPSGETLTLEVKSSSPWTLTTASLGNWLTFNTTSGAAGTTILEITATANTSGGRRSTTVTLENTEGETLTISLQQNNKAQQTISLNPASITIPATGTGVEGQASRGRSCRVDATSSWDVDTTTIPAWLTVIKSISGLTIKAGANTGSERSASIKVFLTDDDTVYATLSVIQEAGTGGTGGITLTDGQGNTSATVQASGGSLTLVLTIPDGDDWTLTPSESWVSVSPASGSGNTNAIAVTVPAYTGSSDRNATITAKRSGYTEGAVFYIIQAAPAASTDYVQVGAMTNNWFVNNLDASANGASWLGMNLRASGAWTASSNVSWIHPKDTGTFPWSGGATDSDTLWFDVDANPGAARTGRITVSLTGTSLSDTFYVNQAGDGTVTLTASFSPGNITSGAQEVDLYIQASNGLAWTIDQISSGLTVPSAYQSGTGSAVITCTVTAASAARTLSCRVRNAAYGVSATPSVYQAGPAATYYLRVTPFGTVNVAATTTSVAFDVQSNTSWTVSKASADSDVELSRTSGSGNNTVTASFPASIRNTARTIPITFSGAGQTITVNIVQAAGEGGMDVTVVPQVVNLAGNGDAVFVTLGSTGNWTASKSDSWISVSPTSGSSGQGQTLTISASRNTGAARTGTVTVTCGNISRVITVNQATDSELLVSSNAVTLGAGSGSQEDVIVYASGMWELDEYSNIWVDAIYTAHAGNANGETLTFRTKSANTSGSPRSVTIRVRLVDNQNVYQEITVTQPSSSTLYVSPTAANAGNGTGTGFIHVTSNTSWRITSIEEGISIASAAQSGTGDADVMYAYTANPNEEIRRCRVYFETTDGEKTAMFTLIQAAAQPAIVIEPDSALWFETGEGGTLQQTRVVTCTGAWTAASSDSWLQFSPSSGSAGSTTVTFTARASLTEVLHATWTVTCGDKTKTLAAHCVPVPSEL